MAQHSSNGHNPPYLLSQKQESPKEQLLRAPWASDSDLFEGSVIKSDSKDCSSCGGNNSGSNGNVSINISNNSENSRRYFTTTADKDNLNNSSSNSRLSNLWRSNRKSNNSIKNTTACSRKSITNSTTTSSSSSRRRTRREETKDGCKGSNNDHNSDNNGHENNSNDHDTNKTNRGVNKASCFLRGRWKGRTLEVGLLLGLVIIGITFRAAYSSSRARQEFSWFFPAPRPRQDKGKEAVADGNSTVMNGSKGSLLVGGEILKGREGKREGMTHAWGGSDRYNAPRLRKGGTNKGNEEKVPLAVLDPGQLKEIAQGNEEKVPLAVLDPGQLKEIAQRCNTLLENYGISPEESWGTAPLNIQKLWNELMCDKVLAEEGFSLNNAPTGGRKRAIVIIWSKIQGWLDYQRPEFVKRARETCPTECVFTNDREVLPLADGVMFHGPTHQQRDFPLKKPPGAKYVFTNLEPSTFRPVQLLLKDKNYMSKFDLLMTYDRHSDVPLGYVGSSSASRYFRSPKKSFEEKDGFGSPHAAAAFISNCKTAGATVRYTYLKELMKSLKVHSFGGCLHNREEPVLVPSGATTNRQDNKVHVLYRYKFLLAFENNNQLTDYVTEKVYNGLQSGTLPVYWGAKNVEDFVPRGSVVKASDFSGPQALAAHLEFLAEDEEAYEAYFKWRDDPEEERRFEEDISSRSAYGVNAMCRLCDRVLQNG